MLIERPVTAPDRVAPADASAGVRSQRLAVGLDQTLTGALDRLVDQHGTGEALRPALIAHLKGVLEERRTEIRTRFEAGAIDGETCGSDACTVADAVIRALAEITVGRLYECGGPTTGEQFDIVATGGYGRGELAPGSDIDLLFLLPYKRTGRIEQIVESMLYVLWDLGLKVGHAVRSVSDCIRQARADITICTNLLESRPLWGDERLFSDFRRRFFREIVAPTGPAYVVAKLAERDDRHKRQGDSRYILEPHVKEGKGGLRDLHTLHWIAKYLYQVEDVLDLVELGVLVREEAARFAKAQAFLATVRCHLHYVTGRTEDRLTFDLQGEISRRMGYTDHAGALGVERFMKHYFLYAKEVGDLTRIFCAALEADAKRPPRLNLGRFMGGRAREIDGFKLDGERLTLFRDSQFRDAPIDMIRLFHVAQRTALDIHPHALRALTRSLGGVRALRTDPEANRLFLEILAGDRDPEPTLRRMNEAGVLGRFVPDFGRVVAQMQYDMYHAYTVDEHTLVALGILYDIDTGDREDELSLATALARKIASRRALFVALLLHDIAKGRGGDHSELGEQVALALCPRLGLTDEETDTVAWLVRHHLAMSFTAFRRDLEDDATVADFVALVQSPERLRLLLILTTADIRAVGPGRWNTWRATLLSDLYHRAEERLLGETGSLGRQRRIQAVQAQVAELLAGWSEDERRWFLGLGYPSYWLGFDPATIAYHASLVRAAERDSDPLTIDKRIDRNRAVTEITIYTADHPGLFAQLTGALALCGADIVDARITTLTNGRALDVFSVQDAAVGGAFESGEKLARLSSLTERTLSGAIRPATELTKRAPPLSRRARAFKISPRVIIDNDASTGFTVIEVNAFDRPGLLHDITRTLTELSLQISSAKIMTYGHKAVDVFYVKNVFGLKVEHEGKLQQIRARLLERLTDPEEDGVPVPAAPAPVRRRPPRRRLAPGRRGR